MVVLAVPADGRYARIRLASHRLWRPTLGRKINLSEVEAHILALDRQFGLEACAFDPWQAELLASRIEADSQRRSRNQRRLYFSKPFMREVQPTAAALREQATLVIEHFTDRRLAFFDCEPLRSDLLKLRCEEKSYGIRLTSPRDGEGHGDSYSAFALALLVGHEFANKKSTVLRSMIEPRAASPLQRALQRLDDENAVLQELTAAGSDFDGREEWERAMKFVGRR